MAKNTDPYLLEHGMFQNQRTRGAETEKYKPQISPLESQARTSTPNARKKMKRINMAHPDDIHAYITYESRRRGISATTFVNDIIRKYMNSPIGHID